MKKIILTFFACLVATFSFANLAGHAPFTAPPKTQISRTIFGIQLGSSSENVKSVLRSKGFSIVAKNTEDGYTIVATNPVFSGIQWDYLYVRFYNDRAYSISFSSTAYLMFESNLYVKGIELSKALYSKYGGNYDARYGENVDVYEDDNTRIYLVYRLINSETEENLYIMYVDLNLSEQREKSLVDEL